jgi:outer membrane lipoprotein-sorting protein
MAAQRRRPHAVLASALLAAALAGVAATPARDLFDDIYDRGRAVDASWKTLTARFTEQSTSSLLTRPLVATGTLAVARPDRVVLEYLEPDRRTVLIDRGTLRVVWPARGLSTERDISASQARVQKYFVDKTPQQLRRHFTIGASRAPDRAGHWHMSLTPTEKRIREGVAGIDLWVDQQTMLLTAMAMTFANGDRKLMEFSDIRLDPDLPAETFAIQRGGVSKE